MQPRSWRGGLHSSRAHQDCSGSSPRSHTASLASPQVSLHCSFFSNPSLTVTNSEVRVFGLLVSGSSAELPLSLSCHTSPRLRPRSSPHRHSCCLSTPFSIFNFVSFSHWQPRALFSLLSSQYSLLHVLGQASAASYSKPWAVTDSLSFFTPPTSALSFILQLLLSNNIPCICPSGWSKPTI